MTLTIDAARRRVSLNPRDPEFFNDPYRAYAAIRARAPAFFWEDYGFWCFARHADVSALLRDRRFGRQILHVMSREELGWPEPSPRLAPFAAIERHSILELEPPEHTRLRNLVNRAFVSKQIEILRPRIAALAHERIDAFAREGSCDLISEFATPIPVAAIADFLGVPRDLAPQLLDWSHRMVAMYQFGVTPVVEDAAAEAASEFADSVRSYARARRADLSDDLISRLIIAESDGGALSEDELVTTVILLLNAGHEATVHAIGNGAKAMLERGADRACEFKSVDAIAATVEELLRLDAPLHLFTRYALEDVEFAGVRLMKGQKIGLLLGAANRDPERFPRPDAFDGARGLNPHVSFGAGIHFCIGAPLAKLEMATALPILFARLPGLRIAEPPRYRDAYHFHGLEALRAEWPKDLVRSK
jgi:cytochrome P450